MNNAAKRLFETIAYATIATVDVNGKPWNTPVFYAHDGENIYWSSNPTSVHSQNIQDNGHVFVVIYNSKAGLGEGLGVYLEGAAAALENAEEIQQALDLLGARRGKPFLHPEKFSGNGPQRIYKATFTRAWTNNADQDADGDFIRDFREPFSLTAARPLEDLA